MKRKGFKLTVGLLMAALFMLFAGSVIAYAADEDTRTHIDRVDISTNIDEVFVYGKENTTLQPTLNMSQTTSEPVTISPYYGKWQRCVDGNWVSDCDEFISGQWRMMIHIRVNDNDANLVDDETKVYVDDELWETWVAYDYGDVNAYIVVIPSEDSERFFIEEPAELTFHKLEKYDISRQRVNSVIESYSVAPSVEGGTRPYSYRKASGPDWLEVSNEGTISGKPTEIGTNEPLVVEVLDSNGGSKQITISVGDTLEENIIEVSTWEELEAAFQWNKPEGLYTTSQREMEYFTIRLMEDLSTNVASLTYTDTVAKTFAIYRAYVTFDFNGHTLSCRDDISSSNYEYQFKDFIRIELHPNSYDEGSALRFIDSVGGGGIEMYSSRAFETCDLSALHLVSGEKYHYIVNSSAYNNSNADHYVYFDGGKYELEARSEKVSNGTLSRDVRYRGCVIAEDVRVEINDGHFYANGEGAKFSVGDTCARELAAFGTFAVGVFNYAVPIELVIAADGSDSVVINGGIFESNGYAVHHFDDAIDQGEWGWSWGYMNFPTINGGYFIGQMGYTGHTFTYSDGTEFYNVLPATTIISENSYAIGINKDGDRFYNLNGMTLKDMHDLQSCVVLGKETVQMKTTPVAGSYPASLIRKSNETETYTIEYKEPSWFAMGGIQCVPYYSIQGWNSGVTPTSKTGKTEVTVDYNKYRNKGGVDVKLGVMYLTPWNTTDYSFENEYNVELQVFYDVTDACENIRIYPVNGEFRVVKGGDFSFTLGGKGNYSHSAVLPLDVVTEPYYEVEAVYGEGIKTTYTIRNVQEDVKIWVQKGPNGPTGQLDLKLEIRDGVLANLERISEGEEYTLLTPAGYEEYGFTMPDGYEFVKWIVTTPTYSFSIEPGEPFILSGAGAVIISPKYENLYNIQVINGKAYADEEHTKPISGLAEDKTAYFVADAPDDGKVFWKWNVIAGSSIHYTDVNEPEFSKTIIEDIVYEACYGTVIDEVALTILSEDIVPEAGKKVPSIELEEAELYEYRGIGYYDVTNGGSLLDPGNDNFKAGHVYQIQLEAWVKDDAGYVFDDIAEMKAVVEGLTGYDSVEFQTVGGFENEHYKVLITFPVIEGPEGVTVSGTITSSGSEGYSVKVTLTNVENENISYVRYLMGNSTPYSIDGVMPGTYTLRVEKKGHVDYEATVTVAEENVVKDVALEAKPLASFKTISLVLESAIDINFWILRDDLCTDEGTYAVIELNGREQIVPMENWTTGSWKATDDSYKISYKGVAAKEMRDLITITVYDSNGIAISNELSYTLGRAIVSTYVYATDEDLKALCVEMLYYGAAAQKVFNYKEDDLATKYFDEYSSHFGDIDHASIRDSLMPMEVLEVINAQGSGATLSDTLASFKTISLVLESAIDINFWILKSELGAEDGAYAVVELNGREQMVPMENWTTGSWKATNDSYKISYKGVAAKEMRDVISITVYDSNGIAISNELSYTLGRAIVSTYAYATDEDLKELCIEMLYYGAAAQKVFNYKESDLATRYFDEYSQYFEGIN